MPATGQLRTLIHETTHALGGEDSTHRPEPISLSGQQAHELLPGVHRVASLAKR